MNFKSVFMSDAFPPFFDQMLQLRSFVLQEYCVKARVPFPEDVCKRLARLKSLRHISFTDNKYFEAKQVTHKNQCSFKALLQVSSLHTLDVRRGTYLSGRLDSKIGAHTNLEVLHIIDVANVHLSLPQELGKLTNLRSLRLESEIAPFNKSIPFNAFMRLHKLTYLSLVDTAASDPFKIGNISFPGNLRNLTIGPVEDFSNALPYSLEELIMHASTRKYVAFPTDLGFLTNLRKLHLFNFNGELPTEITRLTALTALRVGPFYGTSATKEQLRRLKQLKRVHMGRISQPLSSVLGVLGEIASDILVSFCKGSQFSIDWIPAELRRVAQVWPVDC